MNWRTRDECPGCIAGRDELGRMPIGFCGPNCLGRRDRDERTAAAELARAEAAWMRSVRARTRR